MGCESMTNARVDALISRGVWVARQAVSLDQVNAWRTVAEARYTEVDAVSAQKGPWAVAGALGLPFVPTASSLGLEALGSDAHTVERVLTEALGSLMQAALGAPIRPLVESAWVRRQFAPRHMPRYHAPHAWHQDGGLGFDYLNDPDLEGGLLPMVTCWCPLVSCGEDAPGVAYLPNRPGALLVPEALSMISDIGTAPVLAPGDVLMMMGDLLHRTHVTPAMRRDRISVELRFVPSGHAGRRGPWSRPTEESEERL